VPVVFGLADVLWLLRSLICQIGLLQTHNPMLLLLELSVFVSSGGILSFKDENLKQPEVRILEPHLYGGMPHVKVLDPYVHILMQVVRAPPGFTK
jgi:hypothetical protein